MSSYGYMADVFTDDWYIQHPGGESSRIEAESIGSLDYVDRGPSSPEQSIPGLYKLQDKEKQIRDLISELGNQGMNLTNERGFYRLYKDGAVILSFFKSTYDMWSLDYKLRQWKSVLR